MKARARQTPRCRDQASTCWAAGCGYPLSGNICQHIAQSEFFYLPPPGHVLITPVRLLVRSLRPLPFLEKHKSDFMKFGIGPTDVQHHKYSWDLLRGQGQISRSNAVLKIWDRIISAVVWEIFAKFGSPTEVYWTGQTDQMTRLPWVILIVKWQPVFTVRHLGTSLSSQHIRPSGVSIAGPTVWNSVPDELRDPACGSDSVKQFLKTILFSLY